MGFNNGYDSGYSDCEAENRKRWEREAVERYKAENPPSGGSSVDLISSPRVVRASGSPVGELYAGSTTTDNVTLMYMGTPDELFGNIDTTITQRDTHSYDLAFTDNFPDGQLFCVYVIFSPDQPTALSFVVNGYDCGTHSVSSITENDGPSCVAWFQKQAGDWKFLSFQPVA